MRYFEARKARIEIVPMIDIMLFLLVFFVMLTLRMIPTSGHVTRLPTSATAATIAPPKLLVEVDAQGQWRADANPVSPSQLTALVRSRDPSHLTVTVAGAQDVSLQQLMHVIDAVRSGGASQVSLAAASR